MPWTRRLPHRGHPQRATGGGHAHGVPTAASGGARPRSRGRAVRPSSLHTVAPTEVPNGQGREARGSPAITVVGLLSSAFLPAAPNL